MRSEVDSTDWRLRTICAAPHRSSHTGAFAAPAAAAAKVRTASIGGAGAPEITRCCRGNSAVQHIVEAGHPDEMRSW